MHTVFTLQVSNHNRWLFLLPLISPRLFILFLCPLVIIVAISISLAEAIKRYYFIQQQHLNTTITTKNCGKIREMSSQATSPISARDRYDLCLHRILWVIVNRKSRWNTTEINGAFGWKLVKWTMNTDDFCRIVWLFHLSSASAKIVQW